ncbi:MAG TPA: hypothetical protein VJ124_00280 [Pyrinomonadaceae bacterium]|nr:hypothetical protein [Pyrinomonadaceae bacterium]
MSQSQQQTLGFEGPATDDTLPGRLRLVVLTEMTRRRRLLGEMSSEQERALEALLVLTVEKISERIAEITRRCATSAEIEKAQV